MDIDNLSVKTTNGETFTGADSCVLAFLIYKRFGRDPVLAASKYRDMLGNSCPEAQFCILAALGEKQLAVDVDHL